MMAARSRLWWVAMAITVIGLAIFFLGPMAYLLLVAWETPRQFLAHPLGWPHRWDGQNFSQAWHLGHFSYQFINSFVYTGGSTALGLGLAILLAYPVARNKIRYAFGVYALILAGFFLPVGIIPLFIESELLHLYNTRLGYILLNTQGALVLSFVLLVNYFKNLPQELEDSAAIEGCGYFCTLRHIIAPLSRQMMAIAAIYSAVKVWNDLIGPVVFLSSPSLYPLTRGLFTFFGSYQSDWTVLAAGIFIVALPLLLLFVFLQRILVENTVAGAIKS